MADQDRWTNDRNRGRYAGEDRSRRGYEDYGQRNDYGRGDEGRSFGGELDNDVYGAGYGLTDYDRDGRYGAGRPNSYASGSSRQGYQSSYDSAGARPGTSRYSSQYRGSSYDPRRYDQGSNGSETSRYGGALGYGANASDSSPRYADQDWSPRHPEGSEHRGWLERTGEKVANFFSGDGHRGRGPKNYTRSDERIRDDVNDRLTADPYLDASEIEVQVASGEVTLTGTVNSRDAKRHAEDVAEHVLGVRHLQNNLRVQQQSYGSEAYGSTGYGASSTTAASAATTSATAGKSGAARSN